MLKIKATLIPVVHFTSEQFQYLTICLYGFAIIRHLAMTIGYIPTITQMKNTVYLLIIKIIAIFMTACGSGSHNTEQRALNYALNGVADDGFLRAYIASGRSLFVFAKIQATDSARRTQMLEKSELVISSETAGSGEILLIKTSIEKIINGSTAAGTVPSWFIVPDSAQIKYIRRRQESDKSIYYIFDSANIIWIYGNGDHW